MKKHLTIPLIVFVMATLFATSAFAWRSVRTGQKNFERAWSAYLFRRADNAQKYFTKAADAFGSALAEKPPSRTTMFASNLAMAGISFYHAGRYQDCIDAMDKAKRKERKLWEAYLFAALSHARLGDKAQTIESLKAYINTSPTQPILSSEVNRQLTDLETDSGTVGAAADVLDKAAFEQFENNMKFTGRAASNPNERCNGNYWWRTNRTPCSEKQYIDN